ncbi:MAG: RNA chaperone Hfq [Holosporales bacterium]|jgi:host factor-I protein|nr:RNA chaperone Hfq [Holosporales bacterium]
MAKDSKIYDRFMNDLVDNKIPVIIFLINGVKLQGVVSEFDEVSIVLVREQSVQLLYRQAISTIVPQNKGEGQ